MEERQALLAGSIPADARDPASRYEVGARTAAYQLWNRHYLSSELLRDELIQSFGGPQSDS